MTRELAGRGELAELVTDHIFGDVNGHMLAAVMHSEGVANELSFMASTFFIREGRT